MFTKSFILMVSFPNRSSNLATVVWNSSLQAASFRSSTCTDIIPFSLVVKCISSSGSTEVASHPSVKRIDLSISEKDLGASTVPVPGRWHRSTSHRSE